MSGRARLATIGMGRFGMRQSWLAALVVCLAFVVWAPVAQAAFGDDYGAVAVNDGAGPAPEVPVFESSPGVVAERAFWAGACDRGPATSVFGDLAGIGGVGDRPDMINVPPGGVMVPAPATPAHCVDWGAMGRYTLQPEIWQPGFEPAWRLGAVTGAGSHPDGTTTFVWNRNSDGLVDGMTDNIHVDLPPGFVANPQAVPVCTAEEFRAVPLLCPPESQVGVLRMYIEAVPFGGGGNLGFGYDTTYPIYNLQPREGRVAELGFGYASGENAVTVRLEGRARTNGDYGLTGFVGQIPAALRPIAQSLTLWGVPWAAENDIWRARVDHKSIQECNLQPGAPAIAKQYVPPGGLQVLAGPPPLDCRAPYQPGWGPIRPFVTTETDCNPAPAVRLATDSFQNPGALTSEGHPDLPPFPALPAPGSTGWQVYRSISPPVDGCEQLGFDPDIDFAPTTASADAASGLDVDLSIPQNNDPPAAVANDPGDPSDPSAGAPGHWRSQAGLATAHLKDTVVTLPAGLSVNPSGAAGLEGCSDAEIGLRGFDTTHGRPLFNDGDPFNEDGGADGAECPGGSIIGTARVQTPLLAEDLTGRVVLGEPKSTDPTSGEMFRLFVVVGDRERGLVAKIFGSTVADPTSGQLTTTFANNPELPFDHLQLRIEGGQRGLVALPQRCGSHGWDASFTPWSSVGAPVAVADVDDNGALALNANCGFGFSPALTAGVSSQEARGSGDFSLRLSRRDGEQWIRGVTTKLPTGLLAAVRGVPLCTSVQAAAGVCPAGSRIGTVDAGAGSGMPFFLERKGGAYLTEGYKGAPYGMLVRVPVVAGPFRGSLELDPITVRAAVHVDRRSGQVSAVSDPLPLIHHGIPLRAREITVLIDRPDFVVNPSDCSPKQIEAAVTSAQGTVANVANRFQVGRCGELAFDPKLRLRLTGRRQVVTGRHPGVRARVTQGDEAGIERARVVLPRSLALDPANAQALCEFEDGTRPDPEEHCPRGSIVGRARAVSPLLNDPLSGPVFFVKNIRIDPDTGNPIRTLPMLVVALRGEIAINLYGESSVDRRNRLVNTFADVPDAPVSDFAMRIRGGRGGILAVTRTRRSRINLCKLKRNVALARFDGHNGARHRRRIDIKTPCRRARAPRCNTPRQKRTRRCKQRRNKASSQRATGQRQSAARSRRR